MLIYGFDFNAIKKPLYDLLEQKKDRISTDSIEIVLKYTGIQVESPLVKSFYDEGKIKSHEINEVVAVITSKLITALQTKTKYLLNSLTKFYRFQSSIDIHYNKAEETIKRKKRLEIYTVTIEIGRLERFPPKLIESVVREFNFDTIGYCENVECIISKVISSKREIIFNDSLRKFSIKEEYDFLNLNSKDKVLEFFKCPVVKDVLWQYFFPPSFPEGTITEITWDMLKESTWVQKRRRIQHKNAKYEQLHDYINEYTTNSEFLEIVNRNNICAFYASVRTARKRHLTTAVIDIDTSSFLRKLVSPNKLWSFIITLTREIVKTTSRLGLEKPLVNFSGKRGVHLLWKVSPGIRDDYGFTTFWESFILPTQKSLRGDPKSLLKSKFGLVKNIIQAILLHTAHNFDLKLIPDQIKVGLGITQAHSLFKLSPFSDQRECGILLDTSSLNGSVHRVFSFHFSSGLISIPITDPETGDIAERYEDFEVVKEEADSDFILENIKKGNTKQYFQFPKLITKGQLEYLLRPNTGLLPIISIINRFSDRWVTSRTANSYNFWIRMFTITNFYDYLINRVNILKPEEIEEDKIAKELIELINGSKILYKKQVLNSVNEYLSKSISFSSFKNRIEAFRNWEFLYKLKPIEIMRLEEFKEILEDNNRKRYNFTSKFMRIYNVFFNWIFYFLNHEGEIHKRGAKAIDNLLSELNQINIKTSDKIKSLTNSNKSFNNKNSRDLISLICFHNICIRFLYEFFQPKIGWQKD